ncbi:MAG: cytidylate kinase-like family protein [Bacteroidales bacterium]|nr:cytidylate kinase-like family protein [Bacteroidales bacterium]
MEKFFDYFDQRHRETSLKKTGPEEGPVITISRLTGCDARQVAESVVDTLNRKSGAARWKWVDKDIIFDIAKELNTNTERVENFYKGIELSNMSVNIDYLFDATINRQSFSINEIADMIVSMYEKKIGRQAAERKQQSQIF